MARDEAYREAEKKIEEARRSGAKKLDFSFMKLTELPESLGQLTQLQTLDLSDNQLMELPESLGQLTQLKALYLYKNLLMALPKWLGQLTQLQTLSLWENQLTALPEWLGQLTQLRTLSLYRNKLTDLPSSLSLAQLKHLERLDLRDNPLNPELAAAYSEGLPAVMAYLRAKAGAQIVLNEAKLILVGEGEVGKSCLLGALRGDDWEEGRPTTHGIEIKPVKVTDPDSGKEITLNGWDFGGQRVYRPTHQLFFSAPAVYLVVWKPREGRQQGFVEEWIRLVKHREPEAKILVVATHGGPQQRQPDIDRQELWDLFGKETVLDFFFVESKPDEKGERRGIEALKQAIARVAATLPEMGRSVPKRWQEVREALEQTEAAYLPLERVLELCRAHQMDDEEARLFVTIEHRLGHLIHYQNDPALRDIVVLKPDWLATAISFVLDDEQTRKDHGLAPFARLSQLWNDPTRAKESRYPVDLHPIFSRLMERFDLSYRVTGLLPKGKSDETSLIAQLVPDNRPEKDLEREWPPDVVAGDIQQMQICRIVDDKGQSVTVEGLFYQLIVRLHRYSLGRMNYRDSVHWQRGLILDDDYNGRALLEHTGNDVRISVRAPYPERFLAMLTGEVKYLVESFWKGLRCEVMVPCVNPCGRKAPGTGLFEVQKLIDSKRKSHPEYPCPVCNEWQDIDCLLRNAPAARPVAMEELLANLEVLNELRGLRDLIVSQQDQTMGRFDNLDAGQRELLSKADASYTHLLQVLTDEAKEGPRLFSLAPVDRKFFNPKRWVNAKFRLTLWCEHSRLPLPALNGKDSKEGVYEIELTRDWFKKAAPFLKVLTGTLSLVLPIASSGIKLALDDTAYKAIEEQLDFGKEVIDASLDAGEKVGGWLGGGASTDLEHGEAIRVQGATLRELHALLKAKDPGFGGLVRVLNKRQEFLWVHSQYAGEY
jgi:GTPase SAR1 family protein